MDDSYGQLPAEPKRFPWKWVAVGIGVMVVIGAVAAVLIVRSNSGRQVLVNQVLDQAADQADVECADAVDKEACRAALVANAARRMGTPEACRSLAESAQDSCIVEVAGVSGDTKLCESLADPALQDSCYTLAVNAKIPTLGVAACDLYPSAGRKEVCKSSFVPSVLVNGEQQDVDTDNDGLSDADEATYKTDPKNPDTDGDGLTDGEEVHIYRSNPLKADTDGDGFSDGEEVKGGYNPNGPGMLVPAGT